MIFDSIVKKNVMKKKMIFYNSISLGKSNLNPVVLASAGIEAAQTNGHTDTARDSDHENNG